MTALRLARGERKTCTVPSADTRWDVLERLRAMAEAEPAPVNPATGKPMLLTPPPQCPKCTGVVLGTPGDFAAIDWCTCPMDLFQAKDAARAGHDVVGCDWCGSWFLRGQHATCATRARGEAISWRRPRGSRSSRSRTGNTRSR